MADTNQGAQAGGGTPLWRRRTFWLGGGALAGLAGRGEILNAIAHPIAIATLPKCAPLAM